MWGSRTSQARTPDRRFQRIQTCLPGEVESFSSPILRQGASDVRYLGGTSADRIPDMRYPGGMRENFRPGEMSDDKCCKGLDPQWVVVQAVEGSSGQLHDHLVCSKI